MVTRLRNKLLFFKYRISNTIIVRFERRQRQLHEHILITNYLN